MRRKYNRHRKNTKRRYAKKRYNKKRKAYASRSSQTIKWNASNGLYIPQKWFGKFRTKCGGVFSTAGANPLGFAGGTANAFYIKFMDLLTPLSNLGGTTPWGSSFTVQTYTGSAQLLNSSMYQNFLVYGFKCKFKALAQGEDIACGMMPTINTTHPSLVSCMSGPYGKYQIFGPQEALRNKPLSCYIDVAKFLGLKKSVFLGNDASSYNGTYAASPTANLYLHIQMKTAVEDNLSVALPFEIELIAYAKLWADVQGTL